MSDQETGWLREYAEGRDPAVRERVVSALPAVERAAVRLYYFDGLKQREVAALMGCSQMQVSRLLRRSCERLHEQLVDAGDAPAPRDSLAEVP